MTLLGIVILEILCEDLLPFSFSLTLDGIVFVIGPEIFKFFLRILNDRGGSGMLIVHLDVVSSQHQLHIAGAPIIEWLPTLVHYSKHCDIIPWENRTQSRINNLKYIYIHMLQYIVMLQFLLDFAYIIHIELND